jgi:hypothetical protein
MIAHGSIFSEFNLPNATTWFYFSLLLAVALFFRFSRLLSVRNWDVLTLFVLVPGLLLLQEARTHPLPAGVRPVVTAAHLVAGAGQGLAVPGAALSGALGLAGWGEAALAPPARLVWFGYLWLLCGSAYFWIRCVVDLALVRRPALSPNLNRSGLAWLGGAFLVCLLAVAVRNPADRAGPVGKGSAALDQAQRRAEALVNHQAASARSPGFNARFWVGVTLAMLCHVSIVAGLSWIGYRVFQDLHAGMAAAAFYLLLPYTAMAVGQVQQVWPMALLVWAVAAFRRPLLAGLLLGVAAGTVFFPALAFPAWLSFYWRRGAGRFTSAFVAGAVCCLALTGLILWLDGDLARSVQATLAQSDWQPWKVPNAEGFWTGVHWAYRIPVFIAYLAFVLTTAFWPAPKNLAHVVALTAAVCIGLQFWYADQGGVYVLWYLPLLLLLVFRPNLSDRRPPALDPETDWLARCGRALGRVTVWLLRAPEPLESSRWLGG